MKDKTGMELINSLIAEIEHSINHPSPYTAIFKEGSQEKSKVSSDKKKKNSNPNETSKPKEGSNQKSGGLKKEKAPVTLNSIDFRVGIIRSVKKHESAEKLYCEEIDVGEDQPRAIASGLVPYYSLEEMQDRKIVVICNLKPRNLVGFKSHGMVLCASKTLENGETKVEFVDPPANSSPGDRIIAEGVEGLSFIFYLYFINIVLV